MDIRSIIDAEPSTSAPKRSAHSNRDEARHETRPQLQTVATTFQSPYGAPPPVHHTSRDHKPPQPPPIQAPIHNGFRSPGASSYQSIQSPYQQTPTSALGSAHFPFPQHLNQSPYGAQGSHYAQRDGHSGGPYPPPTNIAYPPYGQSTPAEQTPPTTTAGSSQAYHSQARPPSSHSVTTPTSAQPQAPNFPRQSPSSAHTQIRGGPQSFSSQQYLSQPSTPLGPPSNFARSSTSLRRESPGLQGHSRTHSGGSYSYQSISAPSPSTEYPGSSFNSPSTVGRRQTQSHNRHSASVERERSLSVSPKTRLPSQPTIDVSKPAMDPDHADHDMHSHMRHESGHNLAETRNGYSQSVNQTPSRSFSLDVNGILNAPTANEHNRPTKESPGNAIRISPQVITPPRRPSMHSRTSSNSESRNLLNSGPIEATPAKRPPTTLLTQIDEQSHQFHAEPVPITPIHRHPSPDPPHSIKRLTHTPVKDSMPADAPKDLPKLSSEDAQPPASSHSAASQPPSRKRYRGEGVPVYAQSSRKICRNPFLLGKRPVKRNPAARHEPTGGTIDSDHTVNRPPSRPETNGHTIPNHPVPMPTIQAPPHSVGSLGPWEPSILNIIPYEEVTRAVSDFLFTQVVLRDDVGVVSNKGVHSQDAVLEIEAKIGQIIDKNTNDRLRIPVMSECVLCRNDPNIRTAFKSSMTETQHRALNSFLNETLKRSIHPKRPTPPPTRIAMNYKHTHERDAFYTLSQQGRLLLPKSIQDQIDPRNGRTIPKVRVTTDAKTGEPIAQIIKVRVADMDIFSPATLFDWRISVNLEMKIEGDFRRYVEPGDVGKGNADRSKDRLSYKHLQYQIDLTQVSPANTASQIEKEHELEIEVASQEIRTQGQLLRNGQAGQYEELVKGFVDNVRILARYCKE